MKSRSLTPESGLQLYQRLCYKRGYMNNRQWATSGILPRIADEQHKVPIYLTENNWGNISVNKILNNEDTCHNLSFIWHYSLH